MHNSAGVVLRYRIVKLTAMRDWPFCSVLTSKDPLQIALLILKSCPD